MAEKDPPVRVTALPSAEPAYRDVELATRLIPADAVNPEALIEFLGKSNNGETLEVYIPVKAPAFVIAGYLKAFAEELEKGPSGE